MPLLDAYLQSGTPYHGEVRVAPPISARGYFEASQSMDGTITFACFLSGEHGLLLTAPIPSIEAFDLGGWYLRPGGQIHCVRLSSSNSNGALNTLAVLKCGQLRATHVGDELKYLRTRFYLANLSLESTGRPRRSFKFRSNDLEIELEAAPGYPHAIEQLSDVGGAAITASLTISSPAGRRTLDEDALTASHIVTLLRLWSGTKTDWIKRGSARRHRR